MTEHHRRLFPDENPFSTAAIRPGAIAFRFYGDMDAARLLARLQENHWRGEIVGPHGSGKSTLLRTLLPLLKAAGRDIRYCAAPPHAKQLPMSAADRATCNETTQVVIEGYELLGRRQQKWVERTCRDQDSGLLITCHQPQGLQPLLHTATTVELAIAIVAQLLPPNCDFITAADVRERFARHGQNLRELLFEMYDLYEQRRPR